ERRDEHGGAGAGHHRHPRRPAARPHHRRHHDAGVPDVHVRAARAGAPPGLRVRAHPQPHARGVRAQRGRAGERNARHRVLVGAGGHGHDDEAAERGRPRGLRRGRVRRHLPAVQPGDLAAGHRVQLRGQRRSPGRSRGGEAQHAADPPGNAHQPHDAAERHRRGGGDREGGGSAAERRQHLCVAVQPAPAGAGRRHRAALGDQVRQRAQRHGGRHHRRSRRRPARAPSLPAERGRRRAGAVGLLAGAARHQDAAPAHAGAQRERPAHRRVAGRARQGEAGLLHGPPLAPAARAGEVADARLHGDDLGGAGDDGAGARLREQRAHLRPGRVAGRRGEPDRPPRPDDARLRPRRAPHRYGPLRRPRPPLLRRRGRGRPDRRPR
ncbi:MAG: Cystathionine gamma-lyase, partial [uncultured Gemmatimonadetes bacterium]